MVLIQLCWSNDQKNCYKILTAVRDKLSLKYSEP